jgi:hypothetical protein
VFASVPTSLWFRFAVILFRFALVLLRLHLTSDCFGFTFGFALLSSHVALIWFRFDFALVPIWFRFRFCLGLTLAV